LDEEDSIKCEACDVPVENERVGDLLKGCEDTAKGAEEVVDDLVAD